MQKNGSLTFLLSGISKLFLKLNPCLKKMLHFLLLFVQCKGFDFALESGSAVNFNETFMTSEDYRKVESVKTGLVLAQASLRDVLNLWQLSEVSSRVLQVDSSVGTSERETPLRIPCSIGCS